MRNCYFVGCQHYQDFYFNWVNALYANRLHSTVDCKQIQMTWHAAHFYSRFACFLRHWLNFFRLITKKFAIDETMNEEVVEAQKEDENRQKLKRILVITVESKYFPISLGPKRALDIYMNDDHRMIRKKKPQWDEWTGIDWWYGLFMRKQSCQMLLDFLEMLLFSKIIVWMEKRKLSWAHSGKLTWA